MEDLLSKKKILNWLSEKMSHLGSDEKYYAFDAVYEEISSGSFNPDPIPLPTIKPGDKVRHRIHKEWGIGEVKESYHDGSGVRCFFPDLRLLERTKFLTTVDLEVSYES